MTDTATKEAALEDLSDLHIPLATSVSTLVSMTPEQIETLVHRCRYWQGVQSVSAFLNSGGLPDGWVYVIYKFSRGNDMHGGISPDGGMST